MKHTRRSFIGTSAKATAALGVSAVIPWQSFANTKVVAPSDLLNVGAIGINGMGWEDLKNLIRVPGAQVVALCDVDENVLNKRKDELARNGKQVKTYSNHRKLLENKDIDVVVIGTPDHWHCLQMVEACSAGKDVYVEKPVGNSIQECKVMSAAQKRYSRVVQVGQWQRSVPHFVDALNFLKTGKIGKIRTVKAWAYQGWMSPMTVKPDGPTPAGVDYNLWLGPAPMRPFNPNRFHFNFRWFWDYAGGLMTDWGVHLIDYALLGMNAKFPKSAAALGGKYAYPDGPEETPDTLTTLFEFDNYNLIWEHAQGISNGQYGRDHGIAYIGNNGTLVLDRGGWEVIPDEKRMEAVPLQPNKGSGLENHMINFAEAVKSRDFNKLACSIQDGVHVAKVCQMGNISYKTGRRVIWDTTQDKFTDEKANALINARYNNGYTVPQV
jgi:predicted dehydrogenase